MSDTFWVEGRDSTSLSYLDLVKYVNDEHVIEKCIKDEEAISTVKKLVASLVGGKNVELIPQEIEARGEKEKVNISNVSIEGEKGIIEKIKNTRDNWRVALYTSGTTGRPKRVEHNLKSLTRSTRVDSRYSQNVWAFAYPPSHIAGLQVLFQALLNKNTIVYVFESSPQEIASLIKEYKITHISATPTFYRTKIQGVSGKFASVRRVTSGGERFETELRHELLEIFPNAEVRNIYALTETGSLLHSTGESFEIPDNQKGNFKVGNSNNLYVHKSLLGDSSDIESDGEWYNTGDIVEKEGNKIRFVGRDSDFFNVGGYRVNPHKIERVINSLDEVRGSVVRPRDSSVTGNIPVVFVEPSMGVEDQGVRSAVRQAVSNLREWERPRKIEIVSDLKKSRTGKRIR